jgi:NAD(P)-dependent dehydrogenase (short-subunit alcohol dehydrogenase family)
MSRLKGKVAIVTGGGRGIGAGIVRCFLEEEANVVVAQRSDVAADFEANVTFVRTDLSSTESITALAETVTCLHGGVDVLVNNAGVMFERHVRDMTEAEWDQILAVNLKAPFLLTQAVLASMEERGGGSIINIGSIEGLAANPGHTAYSATKSGIHGMTRAMAVDLGTSGVRVNAIAPGWIETDLVKEYVSQISDQEGFGKQLAELHPLGRAGQPIDIGRTAAFLASDDAAFITGQVIVVDGGRLTQISLPSSLRELTST